METILISIPIIILTIYLIYWFVNINGEATTISGVLASVCMYMCIIPLIIALSNDTNMLETSFRHLRKDWEAYIMGYFNVLLFVIFLALSYEFGRKKRNNYVISQRKFAKWLRILSIITLIVGGGSFVIYAVSFGGFSKLFEYAEIMRSFSTDKSTLFSSRIFILVVPSRLITVTPFLLLIYRQFAKNKKLNLIFIISSTILASLFYLSDAGKTGILVFLLCVFVTLISHNFKHKWLVTICIAAFSLEIVNYLDALFVYLNTNELNVKVGKGALSYLEQFSFPSRNLLNLDGIASFKGYRYGSDYITGPLNIIPGFNFDPSYVITSEYHSGTSWHIKGGTPNDAITFGYIQGGFLGVIFEAIILGLICSYIDSCTRSLKDTFSNKLLKYSLVILYFMMFIDADTTSIIRGQFSLIILSSLVYLSSKRSNHRRLNKTF